MQALLGYDENQKLTIFLNAHSNLNILGDRSCKGKAFPKTFEEFRLTGADPLVALQDINDYIQQVEGAKIQPRTRISEPKVRPKFGSPIPVKRNKK